MLIIYMYNLFTSNDVITQARSESMGPRDNHYHQLDESVRRVRVLRDGRVLADSTRTILLKEVGKKVHDPVFYFPQEDVDRASLVASVTRTTCPIKGEARYWSLADPDGLLSDAAWAYQEPIEYSRAIAGRIAFNPQHVTLELGPISPAAE